MDTENEQTKARMALINDGDSLGHLRAPQPGRGQTEEWRQRETARRSGCGRKDWWKKHLPQEGNDGR